MVMARFCFQDLDNSLSETCENIEKDSPVKTSNDSSADLTNAFASLNLNQPSTSYGLEMKMPKVAQNYGKLLILLLLWCININCHSSLYQSQKRPKIDLFIDQ